MQIISVTGTKGKSTIVRVLSDIIHSAGTDTLRVDTDGYYINERQKGDLQESKDINKLVTTVSPGRYLLLMKNYYPKFTAVLECSLGCSAGAGLGYRKHNVGIFSNVMQDHLGSSPRLKTKKDIALAKRFIFKRINLDGYAVFNADDPLVVSQLFVIKPEHSITLLPITLKKSSFDIDKHQRGGGEYITAENGWVVIKSKSRTKKILPVSSVVWTFEGNYEPSLYNLLLIVGGLYAHYKKQIPAKVIKLLKESRLDPYGGRLTMLHNKAGVRILVDTAHEKYSMRKVGRLAKKLTSGKTIGVVRLAYDRTDKMISDTGKFIANDFDHLIVYDKIDGYWKKPSVTDPRKKFRHIVGRVSDILYKAIVSKNLNSERIIREDKAIAKAAKLAKPGDVVIMIANDMNIKRSVKWVKQYFKATFV